MTDTERRTREEEVRIRVAEVIGKCMDMLVHKRDGTFKPHSEKTYLSPTEQDALWMEVEVHQGVARVITSSMRYEDPLEGMKRELNR